MCPTAATSECVRCAYAGNGVRMHACSTNTATTAMQGRCTGCATHMQQTCASHASTQSAAHHLRVHHHPVLHLLHQTLLLLLLLYAVQLLLLPRKRSGWPAVSPAHGRDRPPHGLPDAACKQQEICKLLSRLLLMATNQTKAQQQCMLLS
jgi:hypothetical protein